MSEMALSVKVRKAKLVMVGDTSVGKSSICVRFAKGSFTEYNESTIGAAFFTQSLTTDDGNVKFDVWDTAGQERYHALMPMYYHGSSAAVVVFDITRYETFERAKMWIKELKEGTSDECIITLVGNKIDKHSERDPLNDDAMINKFAKDNGLLYIETSAKTNVNIRQLFVMIANALLALPEKKDPTDPDDLILTDPEYDEPFEKRKCNNCVIL
mmetsp:Transcript_17297/g.15539  ORF Transcript_17297/g.15539 Transcript_17297/m.15539 type:complete len:213 (+) Transcript_17297:121-759(+)